MPSKIIFPRESYTKTKSENLKVRREENIQKIGNLRDALSSIVSSRSSSNARQNEASPLSDIHTSYSVLGVQVHEDNVVLSGDPNANETKSRNNSHKRNSTSVLQARLLEAKQEIQLLVNERDALLHASRRREAQLHHLIFSPTTDETFSVEIDNSEILLLRELLDASKNLVQSARPIIDDYWQAWNISASMNINGVRDIIKMFKLLEKRIPTLLSPEVAHQMSVDMRRDAQEKIEELLVEREKGADHVLFLAQQLENLNQARQKEENNWNSTRKKMELREKEMCKTIADLSAQIEKNSNFRIVSSKPSVTERMNSGNSIFLQNETEMPNDNAKTRKERNTLCTEREESISNLESLEKEIQLLQKEKSIWISGLEKITNFVRYMSSSETLRANTECPAMSDLLNQSPTPEWSTLIVSLVSLQENLAKYVFHDEQNASTTEMAQKPCDARTKNQNGLPSRPLKNPTVKPLGGVPLPNFYEPLIVAVQQNIENIRDLRSLQAILSNNILWDDIIDSGLFYQIGGAVITVSHLMTPRLKHQWCRLLLILQSILEDSGGAESVFVASNALLIGFLIYLHCPDLHLDPVLAVVSILFSPLKKAFFEKSESENFRWLLIHRIIECCEECDMSDDEEPIFPVLGVDRIPFLENLRFALGDFLEDTGGVTLALLEGQPNCKKMMKAFSNSINRPIELFLLQEIIVIGRCGAAASSMCNTKEDVSMRKVALKTMDSLVFPALIHLFYLNPLLKQFFNSFRDWRLQAIISLDPTTDLAGDGQQVEEKEECSPDEIAVPIPYCVPQYVFDEFCDRLMENTGQVMRISEPSGAKSGSPPHYTSLLKEVLLLYEENKTYRCYVEDLVKTVGA